MLLDHPLMRQATRDEATSHAERLTPELAQRISGETRRYPPEWMAQLLNSEPGDASGGSVSSETAIKFAAFYCAVDLISRAIAALPVHVYVSKSSGGREKVSDHPVARLLRLRPSEEYTPFAFKQTIISFVLRYGNSYAEIARNGAGRPTEIVPIPTPRVYVQRRDRTRGPLIYTVDRGTKDQVDLPRENVLHIRTMGDGIMGKSPVSLFGESIGAYMAAQKSNASFYQKGMRPGGVLEHPGSLSEEALKRLRAQIESLYAGSANVGRTMIIEEGMKYNALSITQQDAQYIETLVHGIRDVARIFHIPPHKLADLADATFSNVEEANIDWVVDCLQPWCVCVEEELNEKLFLESERNKGYFCKFALDSLMRGNSVSRSAFYRQMFSIGGLSINEIRELEDRNPIDDGGDVHYVPLNMVSAEYAAEHPGGANAQSAPRGPGGMSEPPSNNPDVYDPLRSVVLDAAGRVARAYNKSSNTAKHRSWAASVLDVPAKAALRVMGLCPGRENESIASAITKHLDRMAGLDASPDPESEAALIANDILGTRTDANA